MGDGRSERTATQNGRTGTQGGRVRGRKEQTNTQGVGTGTAGARCRGAAGKMMGSEDTTGWSNRMYICSNMICQKTKVPLTKVPAVGRGTETPSTQGTSTKYGIEVR